MKFNQLVIPLLLSISSNQLYANELIEPIMVTIPAGDFLMGNSNDKNAQPIHKVTLAEFSLGKYEVTVREFRQFIEATDYEMPSQCIHELNGWFSYGSTKGSWNNNSLNNSDFQPVNCVGWQAANAYTKWLAKETGRPYRLPSEAEWEYSARAGTTGKHYFGEDPKQTLVCDYENIADLTGENVLQRETNTSYVNFFNDKSNCADHAAYASIVGMYKPNPFGLHDMISNVVEFLADCYQNNYKNAPSDGSANNQDKCEGRVTRGGSWHWNTFPVSQRGALPPTFAGGVEGFRIALDGKAPIKSTNTMHFAKQLKTAQKSENLRRLAKLPYPDPVKNLTLSQEKGLVILNWDKSLQTDVESYRVYRNAAAKGMFKLLAANVEGATFKDANPDLFKYDYTVVAVRRHQQSDYSNVVTTKVPAWVTVTAPGRVEAELAIEPGNAIVSKTYDVDGKLDVYAGEGKSDITTLGYQLEVLTSGNYNLSYRVAAPKDTKDVIVKINGKVVTEDTITSTGGYDKWQTQQGDSIYLEKGKHKLTLQATNMDWVLNWFSFDLIK